MGKYGVKISGYPVAQCLFPLPTTSKARVSMDRCASMIRQVEVQKQKQGLYCEKHLSVITAGKSVSTVITLVCDGDERNKAGYNRDFDSLPKAPQNKAPDL